jgi:hypothetical protein
MAQAWASYWFTLPLAGVDGVHSDIEFHAYHYTQVGAAHWQLLGLVGAVRQDKYIDISRLIREEKAQWSAMFQFLGWGDLYTLVQPSEKAVAWSQANGGNIAATAFTRQSWTIATKALLALLAAWVSTRKKPVAKAASLKVLQGFLCRLVDAAGLSSILQVCIDEFSDLCKESAVDEDGPCCHTEAAISCSVSEHQPQCKLAMFLSRCVEHMWACPACKAMAQHILDKVASHIDERLPDLGLGSKAFQQDIHLARGHKKRIISEDFKAEVTETFVKAHKVQHGGSLLHVVGIDHRRLIEWQDERLGAQVVCNHRVFGQASGTFNMAQDSARLGNPAEETTVYIITHIGSDVSTFMPNQVPTKMKHIN